MISVHALGVKFAGDGAGAQMLERVGFKYFTIIIAILFVVFIALTCANIREKSTVDMQTATIGQMFSALVGNDQTMAVVVAIVLINSAMYITSNLVIYFFKKNRQGFSVIQLPRGIAPFLSIDMNKCLQTCVWYDILYV